MVQEPVHEPLEPRGVGECDDRADQRPDEFHPSPPLDVFQPVLSHAPESGNFAPARWRKARGMVSFPPVKRLHRRDLWCWSEFNEDLDIDFNGFAWIRDAGNVLVDPPPMTPHDREHLRKLGGAALILLTNSFHVRGAPELAAEFGAKIYGPSAEREEFPAPCAAWLRDGDEPVPGLFTFEMDGSKTPGELAFVLGDHTVLFGDLVRAHRADELMLLRPEQGLADRAKAADSIRRLLEFKTLQAILVGDGWCIFRDGFKRLADFVKTL